VLEGDERLALERYGDLLIDYPTDSLAVLVAHALEQRERAIESILPLERHGAAQGRRECRAPHGAEGSGRRPTQPRRTFTARGPRVTCTKRKRVGTIR
jgi:hypothetical protein